MTGNRVEESLFASVLGAWREFCPNGDDDFKARTAVRDVIYALQANPSWARDLGIRP